MEEDCEYKDSDYKKTEPVKFCAKVTKWTFILYNLSLLLCGTVTLGLGVWTLSQKWYYLYLVQDTVYKMMIITLVVTGTATAGLGCLGLLARSKTLLTLYTVLTLLGFMMEAFIGLLSYIYQERVSTAWSDLVDPSFTLLYHSDPMIQRAVDAVQQQLLCCGQLIFTEWRDSAWALSSASSLVPDSCCKTPSPGCGERDHPSNIPYTGCAHKLTEELEKDLSLNTTISFGVCLLLVIGVVVTTCHLGGDTRVKRRPETRHQRAEMIMIRGVWRSKPALESH